MARDGVREGRAQAERGDCGAAGDAERYRPGALEQPAAVCRRPVRWRPSRPWVRRCRASWRWHSRV